MKVITIFFLNKFAEDIYKKSIEPHRKLKGKEKLIYKLFFKERLLSEEPLIIEISCKAPRVSEEYRLDYKIMQGLEAKGLKLDLDFRMEII